MSALTRAFQFFSGLGTVATTSLVTTFSQGKENKLLKGHNRLISGAPEEIKEAKKAENNVLEEAISIITKQEGEGESKMGCFWVPNFPGTEIFFCFDTQKDNVSPFLFHYSWRGSKPMNEKLHIVESITSTKAQFQNNGSANISLALKPHLAWTYKWKPSLNPKEHCKMVKNGENYKLNCNIPDNAGNTPTWSRDVSKSIVVTPNKELQKQI